MIPADRLNIISIIVLLTFLKKKTTAEPKEVTRKLKIPAISA